MSGSWTRCHAVLCQLLSACYSPPKGALHLWNHSAWACSCVPELSSPAFIMSVFFFFYILLHLSSLSVCPTFTHKVCLSTKGCHASSSQYVPPFKPIHIFFLVSIEVSVLLHNCKFFTLMNHNVNIWHALCMICNLQRGHNLQVEKHCPKNVPMLESNSFFVSFVFSTFLVS